jgi:hypothetical protein
MDATDPPICDDRSRFNIIPNPAVSDNRIRFKLQRGMVSALANSIREFRKRLDFSSAWNAALESLRQHDLKEYRNALDFVDQLLKEFLKELRRTSRAPVQLRRIFSHGVREGQSISPLEEDLVRLACNGGQAGDGVDPAWDAVYDQILLRPQVSGQPRPITRSFDELLQVRGLNLRREITTFLQHDFSAQFAKVVGAKETRRLVWDGPLITEASLLANHDSGSNFCASKITS